MIGVSSSPVSGCYRLSCFEDLYTYRSSYGHILSFLLGKYLWNGMVDNYDKCVFIILRSYQTAFPSGCTSLFPYQHCMRVPVPPHPLYSLFSFGYSTRCVMVSHCVLLCILWMTNDVEHLILCLLSIHTPLLKCPSPLCIFFYQIFWCFVVEF